MHLAPLALTFALLCFWTALGWAAQVFIKPKVAALPSLLLAPLVGFSVTLVPVFWLNLIGLPTNEYARPLTIALAVAAAVGLIIQRPAWRWSHYSALIIVGASLVLIGLPSLRFSFDWIANSNDDWANYNLGAMRMMKYGLLHRPNINDMLNGKDYLGYDYFLTVAQDTRPGSDLMLAWLASLVGVNPFYIFMPLILCFFGISMCAASALALIGTPSRTQWMLGLLFTVMSPLGMFGVHQQLIAQEIGVAFTLGLAALTCVPLHELANWRRLFLVALVSSAYILSYPEMVPFFGITFLIFHAFHVRKRHWGWAEAWRVIAIPVGLVALTGPYLVSAILFLMNQFSESTTQGRFGGISIFPYFVVPSGAATLWGLVPLGSFLAEPWLSVAIVAGLLLSASVLIAAVLAVRKGSVIALLLIVFCIVALQLALVRNDFGLFKIAMFVQPVLWFVLFAALRTRGIETLIVTATLGLAVLWTDSQILHSAFRDGTGGASGIAAGSKERVLHSILDNVDSRWCDAEFETAILPLAKILASREGCERDFSSRPIFDIGKSADWIGRNPLHRLAGIDDFVKEALERLKSPMVEASVTKPDGSTLRFHVFQLGNDRRRLGVATETENLFNAAGPLRTEVQNMSALQNHLQFVMSDLGDAYYIPQANSVSFYPTEPDPFFNGGLFQAVGRYILFKVLSPSTRIRLSFDLSTTEMYGTSRRLPPVVVLGRNSVHVPTAGNGSSRVLSPPVEPFTIGDERYVLIDLGRDSAPLLPARRGAMALYGTRTPVDYRSITAFVRRVAAEDADTCQCKAAPTAITDVKAALGNPALRYSGIYEDGWIGQDGFVELEAPNAGKVEFRAMMPAGIGIDRADIRLSIDGGQSITESSIPGEIAINIPVEEGPHRILWHFSSGGTLPGRDGREAAALLKSITIVETNSPP